MVKGSFKESESQNWDFTNFVFGVDALINADGDNQI